MCFKKCFYVLAIICLILVQILVVLTWIMYQSNFGDSQSFFELDALFCQDVGKREEQLPEKLSADCRLPLPTVGRLLAACR